MTIPEPSAGFVERINSGDWYTVIGQATFPEAAWLVGQPGLGSKQGRAAETIRALLSKNALSPEEVLLAKDVLLAKIAPADVANRRYTYATIASFVDALQTLVTQNPKVAFTGEQIRILEQWLGDYVYIHTSLTQNVGRILSTHGDAESPAKLEALASTLPDFGPRIGPHDKYSSRTQLRQCAELLRQRLGLDNGVMSTRQPMKPQMTQGMQKPIRVTV